MSSAHISRAQRQEVRARAKGRCEYCLLPEDQAFFPHEPDHIIAIKHGGQRTVENLALACFDCNRFKGSDIASLDPVNGKIASLFNPRSQNWREHFSLAGGVINSHTATGRVTELLLKFNLPVRIEVRAILASLGRY